MFKHTREVRNLARRTAKAIAVAALVLGTVGAQAGIANTKHNLGATSTNPTAGGDNVNYMTAGANGEICVFCHTPHASNTNVKAPLWNKPVAAGTSYTTYSTATSATIEGSVDMSGVSLACLSCHDGTQAMDTMINKPGSGGYDADGSRPALAAWTGANQIEGKMNGLTTIAMLDTDLSNDHPVGIQYCGGGLHATGSSATATISGSTCRDADFNAAQNAIIGGTTAWWVDSTGAGAGPTGARQKTDMILYARSPVLAGDTATTGKYQPFVECSSCHDPHSENTTFLRIANVNSKVCLTCHNK